MVSRAPPSVSVIANPSARGCSEELRGLAWPCDIEFTNASGMFPQDTGVQGLCATPGTASLHTGTDYTGQPCWNRAPHSRPVPAGVCSQSHPGCAAQQALAGCG